MYTILQSANIQTQCVNNQKTVAEKILSSFLAICGGILIKQY